MPQGKYVEHLYGKEVIDPPGWTKGLHKILFQPICPHCLNDSLSFRGEGLDTAMDLYYDQYVCGSCGKDSYEYH